MTELEFKYNYNSLVDKLAGELKAYVINALRSGAFDLAASTDTYRIPKNVLVAALMDNADAYGPSKHPTKGRRTPDFKEIENIWFLKAATMKTYWTDAAWERFDADEERDSGRGGYETYCDADNTKELKLTSDERTEFEEASGIAPIADVIAGVALDLMIRLTDAKER